MGREPMGFVSVQARERVLKHQKEVGREVRAQDTDRFQATTLPRGKFLDGAKKGDLWQSEGQTGCGDLPDPEQLLARRLRCASEFLSSPVVQGFEALAEEGFQGKVFATHHPRLGIQTDAFAGGADWKGKMLAQASGQIILQGTEGVRVRGFFSGTSCGCIRGAFQGFGPGMPLGQGG